MYWQQSTFRDRDTKHFFFPLFRFSMCSMIEGTCAYVGFEAPYMTVFEGTVHDDEHDKDLIDDLEGFIYGLNEDEDENDNCYITLNKD